MTIFFTRRTLRLTTNSTLVEPVEVMLNDSQDFWVDPNIDPWADDGEALNLNDPTHSSAITRAFFITDCKRHLLVFRTGKLNMKNANLNNAEIAAWHANFNSCRAIVLPMRLANGTAGPNLIFDPLCTQHSAQPVMMHAVQRAAQAAAFVALAFVNFTIAVLTLRIFKQPKARAPDVVSAQIQGDSPKGRGSAGLA